MLTKLDLENQGGIILDQLTDINLERFSKSTEVIAPIINGRGVFKGRHFKVSVGSGWYKIRLGDKVKVLKEADEIERDEALSKMPIIEGYTIADSIVPLNWDSAKFRFDYNETIPVMFIRSELWDIIKTARWYDNRLYYKDLSYGRDTSVIQKVRAKFEAEKSLEDVKGASPELRYVYILLCLQRDNYKALKELEKLKLSEAEREKRLKEFQETLPGRVLKTVENAGGKLVRFHKQGPDKLVVIWKCGRQTINSLINLDFRILEAGYCLEGEDQRHSLSSIIPLAKIFQEREPLYITRE